MTRAVAGQGGGIRDVLDGGKGEDLVAAEDVAEGAKLAPIPSLDTGGGIVRQRLLKVNDTRSSQDICQVVRSMHVDIMAAATVQGCESIRALGPFSR